MVPFGKAKYNPRVSDVTIVTTEVRIRRDRGGRSTRESLGIDAEIVDLRTLNLLDMATVVARRSKPAAQSSLTKDGAPAAPALKSPRRFTKPPSTRSTRPSSALRSTLRCRITRSTRRRECWWISSKRRSN